MRNLDDEPFSGSLAGSLLVAHPNMLDPNFRRTVLFISEHDPNEGALGVIINRPLETEVKQKAWLLQKANPSLLKIDRLPNLWFEIMRNLGPWYKMLAAAPDDPSLN